MSRLLLLIAFVLTGLNSISNKALIEWSLSRYAALYLTLFWGVGVVIGLVVRAISRHEVHKRDVTVGVAMGIMGATGMIFLMIALRNVSGVVAFPVRSCANVALTAGASYMLWREDLTRTQWLGIACAIAAIYLLV